MATKPKTDVTLAGDAGDADDLAALNERIATEAAAATTAEARAGTAPPPAPVNDDTAG
jgi:hypothetical protein